MAFLPISIQIDTHPILIIGGGHTALHKIQTIKKYSLAITVLAESFSPSLEQSPFRLIRKSYQKEDLKGFYLIYACTDNKDINKRIADDAASLGLLCNVCDNPALCDFVSPAVYKQGKMSVAVSSNGEDVKRSIAWRNQIKEMLET